MHREKQRSRPMVLLGALLFAVAVLALPRATRAKGTDNAVAAPFNPVAQRAEMIRLLRSIDEKLGRLLDRAESSRKSG